MLTKEFKEVALQKLKQMSADDFVEIFEKIGSQRTEGEDNLCAIIEQDLSNYDMSSIVNPYAVITDCNIKSDDDYSGKALYFVAA